MKTVKRENKVVSLIAHTLENNKFIYSWKPPVVILLW